MPFKPGQSGNPRGRKPGSRNRKTIAADLATVERFAAEDGINGDDLDPLVFLASVVSDHATNKALRIQAASLLAPYRHSRCTTRRISQALALPLPTSVEQATETIAKLSALACAGQLGLDEANDLIGHQKAYIEAKIGTELEARLAAIEQVLRQHPQLGALDLQVIGGMPALPGSDIIMPTTAPAAAELQADRDPGPDLSDGEGDQ